MTDASERPATEAAIATGRPPRESDDALFAHFPLLETCRTKWQYGEWRDLAAVDLGGIEEHPDRAKIVLLVGAAKTHLGDMGAARGLLRRAQDWGCSRDLIARVLASMIHNSLGRIAASLEDDAGATRHFEAALTLVEPRADAPLLARTRRVRETARMGLLPDAASLLGEDLRLSEDAPIDHMDRLTTLNAELNLLSYELSLSDLSLSAVTRRRSDHPIFSQFSKTPCVGTGAHVFDFLGGATRAAFSRGWAAFATPTGQATTPNLPPKNEHYLDWIAVLSAAAKAKTVFRMAELGAGWAPWLVRGALAARQRPEITSCELLAIEADQTHYQWARAHFADNNLDPDQHHMLHGAVAENAGLLRFPITAEPDADYSTSLTDAATAEQVIEVRGYTISELMQFFSGPLDFLHVDIQGAEAEVLPPAMALLSQSVRAIMIGTHSDEIHSALTAQFLEHGWRERLNLDHNRVNQTPWGEIKTDDGFLWFENTALL